MSKKKLWDNSSLQQDIEWGNQTLDGITDEELYNTNWNRRWSKTDATKKRIGDKMRGKTLEEIVGEERAIIGRKTRAKSASHSRPKEVVNRILATKKDTGVYESPNHGMRGKQHQEKTKLKQSAMAQVRQELKRRLGLGRNDSIPKDILEAEYKNLGLK